MSPNARTTLPRLLVKGLCQEFDKMTVLRDITFELRAGERLSLLGPTGSGKTTLLRAISGLDALTAGEIFLGDQSLTKLSPHRRRVSFVFQDRVLYPHLSVRENLSLVKRHGGTVAIAVNRVAELLQINSFLDRRPDQLSGGEQQRVAIARALAASPQVLCLDEPFSNLDITAKASLRDTLLELHAEFPATWILVTHDPTDAMLMGQRTAVLERGELLQLDTTENLQLNPDHHRVAELTNDPPLNLVTRRAVRDEVGWQIDHIRVPDGWSPASVAGDCDVLVGFRPEDANVADKQYSGSSDYLALPLLVRSVIRTQGQTRLDGSCAGRSVSVLMPHDHFNALNDKQVTLRIAVAKLLFFDYENGRRIR